MLYRGLILLLATFAASSSNSTSRDTGGPQQEPASWKAGVAKVMITPEEPVWLAGYASRDKPSQGKLQDLYVKALAFEDPGGKRAVLVTSDLIGITQPLAEAVRKGAKRRGKVSKEQLMLTSSHTHTGPVIRESLIDMYPLSPEQSAAVIRYSRQLEEKVVQAVEQAVQNLSPASLYCGWGQAEFAVNRRVSTPDGYKIGVNPDGPVDRRVPVLRVDDPYGRMLAIVFGYACHNTTLTGGFYQLSGDYAGFAQTRLESKFPQATALFFMGCGADANPNPRGELEHAEKHGQEIADAVTSTLAKTMHPISGNLKTRMEYVDLPFAEMPSRSEFEERLQHKELAWQRHAQRMLEVLEKKGKLPQHYAYPIQVWQFGPELTWVALAGEVVVDYALRLQEELNGDHLWTLAYANDVFAYIPSARILQEGGYEADQSGVYYGMPTRFSPEVEQIILKKTTSMVKKVRGR